MRKLSEELYEHKGQHIKKSYNGKWKILEVLFLYLALQQWLNALLMKERHEMVNSLFILEIILTALIICEIWRQL